jgi:hypothetical protein
MIIPRDLFEVAVYRLLFPEGMIPLSCKSRLGLIDSQIAEIHSLAQGNGPAPKPRRVCGPVESAELTRKIVELRDGPTSPSWRDIAKELGNTISSDAVRCRYQDAKALQEKMGATTSPAPKSTLLLWTPGDGVKPELENPTIRDFLIVEEISEVSTAPQIQEPSQKGVPPISKQSREEFEQMLSDIDTEATKRFQAKEDPNAIISDIASKYTDLRKGAVIERLHKLFHRLEETHPTIRDNEVSTVPQIQEPSQKGIPSKAGGQIAEHSQKVLLPEAKPIAERKPSKLRPDGMLTPCQKGQLTGPKIPHSEDQYIFTEKESGKTFGEIRKTLVQKGYDCTANDVSQRYYTDLKKRMAAIAKVEGNQTAENVAPEEPASPSPPGAEGAQELAREAIGPTRGTPEEKEEKPEPRSISRAERDLKIWDLWKEGKSPEAISDLIYAEGLYFDARAVRRILLQQGASL